MSNVPLSSHFLRTEILDAFILQYAFSFHNIKIYNLPQ
ncbi:hypothetical protein X975_08485, partial [Stegodyphus mimosarum]